MQLNKRISSILLWSIVSAAFIGPGTLATATAAGAQYGTQLIWALVFSTIACLVLQEMAARITIISGEGLGSIMKNKSKSQLGVYFIGFSVVLGCAAYQAGNILGAISGVLLFTNFSKLGLILATGLCCGALLWKGSIKLITTSLGILVAIMGLMFLFIAFQLPLSWSDVVEGATIPNIPDGASWIVLGLVGTTIVPYNLFLGAGVAKNEVLSNMRFGLSISVLFGGIISIAILLVATNASSESGFADVANVLGSYLGNWAFVFMGVGLFAAGITSSITSPMAAAIITSSIIGHQDKNKVYRMTWISVLFIGMLFGMLDFKPLSVIIAAQALNGLVLPLMVIVLIIFTNNKKIMGETSNSWLLNILCLFILNIVLLIGFNNCLKSIEQIFTFKVESSAIRFMILQVSSILPLLYTIIRVIKSKKV
ncbi:divalent metal cation transporter [Fulvivirga sp.]|uniref:NRAMP family divalent metal transporter n=1 Tax=Fulvivirga sp. TaxID=1931237 RepID=UPI0032ED5F2D